MPVARRTDAVLLLVALVWGSSYLAAGTATAVLPVLVVLFARYALSALTCAGVNLFRRGRRWSRAEWRAGAVLGLTQAFVLALETYGVAYTSAANAGLLISLSIVLTPVLDRRRGQRGLPPRFFLAAGLCVVAVGLLSSGAGLHPPRLGDGLILAAAVARAGHVALVGRITVDRPIDPMRLTTIQTLVGTLLFLGPAVTGMPALATAGPFAWAQLVHLAVLCSVFAFLAQTWAVQRTSASRASLLLGTEPVWAVGIGIGLGGEEPTAAVVAGAVLMVAGTYWGQAIERGHRAALEGKIDQRMNQMYIDDEVVDRNSDAPSTRVV